MSGEIDKTERQTRRDGAIVQKPGALAPGAAPGKLISAAAKRALREADARRQAAYAADPAQASKEYSGPKGAEPTRFGDWERGGIAYDF
ncbi:DUF1674 domain-containing protein [Robiginitomaculum antarcticum]|uniref:DUF1674 domain-containing protein n=1 Tax=Robiginitomaculum antarcticum TaxID=437507 RepID=UPI0003635F2F|nr:DUF1674 domain-containing protein [Robiginitomaculum antarcticum]